MKVYEDKDSKVHMNSEISRNGLKRKETYSLVWTLKSFSAYNTYEFTSTFNSKLVLKVFMKCYTKSDNLFIEIHPVETRIERNGSLSVYIKTCNTKYGDIEQKCSLCFYKPKLTSTSQRVHSNINTIKDNYLDQGKLVLHCELSLESDLCFQNNATCSLSSNFRKLLEHATFSDVVLNVKGSVIPAHKLVLAAGSPVFKAMFEHQMKESEENSVVVEDVKPEVMKAMIAFMYTGEIEDVADFALDLLAACNKYQLNESDLFSYCEEVLGMDLTVENVCESLVLADRHQAGTLKDRCVDVIMRHLPAVMATPGWAAMKGNNTDVIVVMFEALKDQRFDIKIKV